MTTFQQYFNIYLIVCGGIVNVIVVFALAVWWMTEDEIPKQMPDEHEQTDKVRG